MSFLRIKDEAKRATDRALDRYLALLQQEQDWTPEEEAEMRELGAELGKDLAAMSADRAVIARARALLGQIDAGAGLDEKREAAGRAIDEYTQESAELLKQRTAGRAARQRAASELNQLAIAAQTATHQLASLMQQHPMLLGEVAALV